MSNKYEAAHGAEGPQNFAEFFPYYLREHAHPVCRGLHYVGTTIGLAIAAYAVSTQQYVWLWGMPLAGYFFAWIGHFFIEKNKPATFTYPLWSLIGDFKMYGLFISGRLGPQLRELGIK